MLLPEGFITMLKHQRQKDLVDILRSDNIISISELSGRLNASMMTIRRDLEYLEETGMIKRVHGGAVLLQSQDGQPSFHEGIEESGAEKQRIGREAAKLITPESIVFFDSGTTPLAITQNIPEGLKFTAITTGLISAVSLCNRSSASVISIGGDVHCATYTSINHIAVDMIKKFRADLAFISTKAFSFPEGSYETHLPLIEVKKAIVSVSRKVVLVADHSKFDNRALCLSIPLEDIDMIITDVKTPESVIAQLREQGKDVLVV